MIILQGRELTKTYITNVIFNDISFYVQEGEKVGLVGPNGTGKTTLVRCLTGQESLDSGSVMISGKHSMGYLEQMPNFEPGTTLLDAVLEMFTDIFKMRDEIAHLEQKMGEVEGDALEHLLEEYSQLTMRYEEAGGFSCESKAKGIVRGLGFAEEDLQREVNHFSGGEKTRASLARLLVREPDLLLLDEPTNHLDLEALDWLEGFLRNYKGAVLVISHDRYFLDQVVTRVLELNHNQIRSYTGNYSRYLILKEEYEEAQMRAFEKQQLEIAKTEEYIRKYKAGIKSKQARGRQSQLNRLERLENIKGNKSMSLFVQDVSETGEIVFTLDDVFMNYGEKQLFSHANLIVYKGETVGLIGGNGVGKSTILKLIMGQISPSAGLVKLGSRVKVAYYDQEHRQLDENRRIIDEIVYNYEITLNEARDLLAQVLFFGEDVEKYIRDLSGGEKGRVALVKILLEKPNVLVMDEPTNHLDIASKEVVEGFLNQFPGTILMVSHDRYLLDEVTTRTVELADGVLTSYLGNYSYYKEKKTELARIAREKEEAEQNERKQKVNGQKENKPRVNKSKLKAKIEEIELEVQEKEIALEELGNEMSQGANYQDEEKGREMVLTYQELEKQIALLYQQWEEVTEELENA